MATRIRTQFPTILDQEYRVDIDDADYAGSVITVDTSQSGFSLRWDGETDQVVPGIMGSGCTLSILVNEDNESDIESFATDLISSEESRFTIAVYKITAGPTVSLYWCGFLVPDLGGFDDIGSAYFFTVKAVDGVARLKSVEYKDTTPTPDAPYGPSDFLQHLTRCLGQVNTLAYWGGSDVWLRTVVNWSESGMPAPAAGIDPLKYARVSGSVFAKMRNTTDDESYEFFSCFKVIEQLCLHFQARLMLSNGSWRFEQVRERMEENFFERRYSKTVSLLSSTALAGYDANIFQTGDNNRLRGGQFNYLPALSKVHVKYAHNTYINKIEGQDYRWQKNSNYSNMLYSVSGVTFDSDTFFKVSGVLNVNISVTYTKPWRAVFGVLLRLPEEPYRLKSITSISQVAPGVPIYGINRGPVTWDDTGGGFYYEISTQVITSANYKDSIPFSFWTPFIPSGEKGFEINFGALIWGEKVDLDPQVLTLNDWSFKNLVLTFNGLDTAANFEAERIYKSDNADTGNSDAQYIDSIFGHAVKAWTPTRIEVTNDLVTWTNTTATWDRGTETENQQFGQLLADTALAFRQKPVTTYTGTLMSAAIDAHDRIVFSDNSTWLLTRAEFNAALNQWSVEMLKTGITNSSGWTRLPYVTHFPLGGDIPTTFELVVAPGSGTGRISSQADRGRAALALLTGNYVSTNISAGAVTTIPVDLAIKGNAYGDGDLIAVVDPQSGEMIPFVVDGDQPAGATTINVVSKTIEVDIPIGAQVVYSPMNLLTEEGGDKQQVPPGTVQGEILRWNATDEVWEPYGAGTTDGHILTWDSTNGFQSEAPPAGGSVTSVGLSMPSGFGVSGSPVTTSGTLTVTTSLNGPLRGNGTGFTTGNTNLASEVTGTLPVANGGTGLAALGTASQLLRVNAGATALEYFTPTYLTGNQTITLSGDVSGSGATAITTTIGAGTVTLAKMENRATQTFIGRNTAGTGVPEELSVATAKTMLNLSGTNSGDQTITLTSDVTGSGTGTFATTIANNAVTDAKFRQSAALSVVGRSANSTGNVADIAAGTDGHVLRRSGTTLAFGTVATAGIADDAVTFDKVQNITDNRLLGRSAGSAGSMQEITIGSGLSLSSGTLSATGGGITGSGLTNRLAIWSGTSSITSDDHPLYWDGTNNYLGVGTASPAARVHIAVPTGTNDEGLRILGNLSGNLNTTISNANNASSSANNIVNIATGGSSAGDPVIQFSISGAVTWAVGIDNSDSDKFKISEGSTPGSSDRLIIASGGNTGIGTTVLTGRLNVAGSGTTNSTYALLVNNNSATTILSVRDDQRVGVLTTSPTQELHVNGDVIARQFMNTNAPPTISYSTGAGTSPTTGALEGGVNFVVLSFTTGTSPAANGDIFTITFNQSFPTAPIVVFSSRGTNTSTDITKFYVNNIGLNSFTMKANGTLSASTQYQFMIHIGGY